MSLAIDRLTSEFAELLHRADEVQRDARRLGAEFAELEHRQKSLRKALELFAAEIDKMGKKR